MLDLYVSQRASVDAPWGPPQNLGPNINTAGNDQCPLLLPDGHHMIFVSDGRPDTVGGLDLYVTRRHDQDDDFGWESPENLGEVNSPASDYGPSAFEDDRGVLTLYFNSARPGGFGGNDVWASTRVGDGPFGAAAHVPELSSAAEDLMPAVRRDGLELILSSNRPGTLGLPDLWVSTRASVADPWGAPVNMGAGINTPSGELRPALSWDGTTLFFHSNRPGGVGGVDLYEMTRSKPTGNTKP